MTETDIPPGDVRTLVYVAAERDDWEQPRLVAGPFEKATERPDAEDAYVDARMSDEYVDVWFTMRVVDDGDGEDDENDDPEHVLRIGDVRD